MRKFTNSNGKQFDVNGLPPFAEKLLLSAVEKERLDSGVETLPKPTYSLTTLGGKAIVKEHDDKTIKDASDEEKGAWAAWIKEQHEITDLVFRKRIKLAVTCLQVKPLDDTAWLKRMTYLGVVLPDDEMELLEAYASTEVFANVNDAFILLAEAEAESRLIDEGVAESAIKAFRFRVPRKAAGKSKL